MPLLEDQFGLPPPFRQLGRAEAGLVDADDQEVLAQRLRQEPADPPPLVVEPRLVEAQLGRVEGAVVEAEAVVQDLDDGGP